MGWYNSVANDISTISDAYEYYDSELEQARLELNISGSIEKASAKMPGIVEERYSQLQEIEAILELLNIESKRLRSKYFKKYLEHYNRALTSRDVDKYVDGEKEIIDHDLLVNTFALLRNKWLGITKALDIKQWQLTNITKLRCAGLDDASL